MSMICPIDFISKRISADSLRRVVAPFLDQFSKLFISWLSDHKSHAKEHWEDKRLERVHRGNRKRQSHLQVQCREEPERTSLIESGKFLIHGSDDPFRKSY